MSRLHESYLWLQEEFQFIRCKGHFAVQWATEGQSQFKFDRSHPCFGREERLVREGSRLHSLVHRPNFNSDIMVERTLKLRVNDKGEKVVHII